MISLYEASVASYLQTLNAVAGFLDKGLAHFRDSHIDPEEIVESRRSDSTKTGSNEKRVL